MNLSPQLALDLVQPLTPTLDNFVPGRNAEMLAALREPVASTAQAFVYLWGESGSGRSHLLQALQLAPSACVPGFDRAVPIFTVDDIDQLDEADQQRLFNLQNEVRAAPGHRLVVAGPLAPLQLKLREDVRTRLGWGLVYQVHALSDDEKAQALAAHAASRGVSLAPEVVAYLLAHMPRDMRTLVAILDALDGYALQLKRAITVPLIRDWQASHPSGAT